jgi:hypothetical protein
LGFVVDQCLQLFREAGAVLLQGRIAFMLAPAAPLTDRPLPIMVLVQAASPNMAVTIRQAMASRRLTTRL